MARGEETNEANFLHVGKIMQFDRMSVNPT